MNYLQDLKCQNIGAEKNSDTILVMHILPTIELILANMTEIWTIEIHDYCHGILLLLYLL